jgi:hypothetical protein
MTKLQLKDYWILAHVLGISVALTVLMFKHPETSAVLGPTVVSLIGFTHYFLIRDDKVPDACGPK